MRLHHWRGGRTMSCGGQKLLMLTLSVVIVLGQLTDTLAQSTAAEEGVETDRSSRHATDPAATASTTPPPSTTTSGSRAPQPVIEALEKSLLKMFGLNSRPRPSRKVHIPQYMLDLYNDRVTSWDEFSTSDTNYVDSTNTYGANTIRSFLHSEEVEQQRYQGDISDDTHHRRRYYFNVSNLAPQETLTAAQFRIYRQTISELTHTDSHVNSAQQQQQHHQQQQQHTQQHSDSSTDSDSAFNTPRPHRARNSKKVPKQRIDIYEVIRPATRSREAITNLLDTRVVDPRRTSWESFDIRPAVLKWRDAPHLNHGLEVHVRAHNGDSLPVQTGSYVPHIRLRRSLEDTDEQRWGKTQPLLVTYSDDAGGDDATVKSRAKRRARHRKRSRSTNYQKRYQKDECRRHSLYVDFGDVGWDDWIVAPVGYDAFFCHGECGFPLPEHMNTTNHAIVQMLVHSVNPKQVPRPCCVPTELSPISMLYLDEADKVVLKNYQDMVVVGCGCR